MLPEFQYVVYQFAGNRYFCFRVFAEGYADGIAYSVGQQGADTDSTFNAAVFTVTGFGHSQVERVVHVFCLHGTDEQTYGADHDNRVGCFDGDYHVREILVPADAQKFHAGGNHSFGGITIPAHDTVGQ